MGTVPHKGISATERLVIHQQRVEQEGLLAQKLKASRARKNHYARCVEILYKDHEAVLACERPHVLWLKACFNGLGRKRPARTAFRDLLLHLDREGCEKLLMSYDHVMALSRLATYRNSFLRSILDWERPGRNLNKQFSSLIRHCLAKYAVPSFMDQVWFEEERNAERNWFVSMAQDNGILKRDDVPIRLTKRIAHWFQFAPSHSTIEEALRWGQVMGLGGDQLLAHVIVETRLSRAIGVNEEYWEQVLTFLIKQGIPENVQLDQILDFLFHRLEEGNPVNLKGRTTASLSRMTNDWHREIARQKAAGEEHWGPCTFGGAEYVIGKEMEMEQWRIVELVTKRDLVEEGSRLRHCVASYAPLCIKRTSAIFSITVEDALGNKMRMGTIQVDLRLKKIVQGKSRYNAKLKSRTYSMLERWAHSSGLTIANKL